MSRPIPIEVVPSHLHLSEEHHRVLFGDRHSGTIRQELSQSGQFVYDDIVEIIGAEGRVLPLHVLGPSRKVTQVELTPTEAMMLGIDAPMLVSGSTQTRGICALRTTFGILNAIACVLVPQAHLHLSDSEAQALRLEHGAVVRVDLVGDAACVIENVAVRVHPTYRARFHVHPDIARDYWLPPNAHVRVRDIQNRV